MSLMLISHLHAWKDLEKKYQVSDFYYLRMFVDLCKCPCAARTPIEKIDRPQNVQYRSKNWALFKETIN